MSDTSDTSDAGQAEQPDHDRAERARQGDIDLSLFGDGHIARYEETDGAVGHIWNGAPCLVLTTVGARSGQPRKHALIYGRDGDDVLVVASAGGAPDHPQWYDNLVAQPEVEVQVLGDRYPGLARTASPEEKARLWPTMVDLWPAYEDYQAATPRDIPVVVISPR
jgi:deazaflavin-dependent oxidoreductase (nitroreductase family)